VSDFLTTNNESAIAPWGPSLEPIKAITEVVDPNRVLLTGGLSHEVNTPTLMLQDYDNRIDNRILSETFLTPSPNVAILDFNSSLPDSDVDLLTGQAMSEVDGDLIKLPIIGSDFVAQTKPFEQNIDPARVTALAQGEFNRDFSDPLVNVVLPVKEEVTGAWAGPMRDRMVEPDLTDLTTLAVEPGFMAQITPFEPNIDPARATALAEEGFKGEFSDPSVNPVLSAEIIEEAKKAFAAAIADVLPEEIEPSVDSLLKFTDVPGDEGEISVAVV